jgi:hypothetical protein
MLKQQLVYFEDYYNAHRARVQFAKDVVEPAEPIEATPSDKEDRRFLTTIGTLRVSDLIWRQNKLADDEADDFVDIDAPNQLED